MLNKILNYNVDINKDLILKLISFIDLTTLNDTDNKKTVLKLIDKANIGFEGVYPAAVCVFSNFGQYAKQNVKNNINVAVVATCFPTGQSLTDAKLYEIELVNQTDVDEVDIVINRGEFLAGNLEYVSNEISEIRKRLPQKHLKVILETGELESKEDIFVASKLAIEAGADFIKTSTGKTSVGSTPEAVFYMCEEIKRYHLETGKKIGIKPAGGIRTLDDSIILYKIVKHVLGDEWLTPKLFRIGASSLYDNLIKSYNNL
jgi:deoxyribose-phosphate aldolase